MYDLQWAAAIINQAAKSCRERFNINYHTEEKVLLNLIQALSLPTNNQGHIAFKLYMTMKGLR